MKKCFGILIALTAITFTNCDKSDEINDLGFEDINLPKSVEFTADEQKVLRQMRNKDNKIGMEEALQLANDVIGFLEEESATKSGASRKIASVVALHNEKDKKITTKSAGDDIQIEMPDTLAYLFNFTDSAGYTIIAADTRIESPILCYTGSGTLKDTIVDPGIAIFLEGAEYYVERSIIEAEQMRDSLIADILSKIDETGVKDTIYIDENEDATKALSPTEITYATETRISYSYGPWTVASRVGPLSPVEWNQGYPYNMLAPLTCSSGGSEGRAWAGCVATAIAQIMAYWRYPASIDGYSINWNLLNNYTGRPNEYDNVMNKLYVPGTGNNNANQVLFKQNVSRLMERIGSHVGMDYGCGGSGANMENTLKYLRSIGYAGGNIEDFNTTSVLNSLNSNRPVLSAGNSTKIHHSLLWGLITWSTYSGGHAWVMDGYLRQQRQVTVTATTTKASASGGIQPLLRAASNAIVITTTTTSTHTEYSSYYLHQNWGWNGYHNGYYVAGTFDSNKGGNFPSGTKSGEAYNYQYNNEIFPNIRR